MEDENFLYVARRVTLIRRFSKLLNLQINLVLVTEPDYLSQESTRKILLTTKRDTLRDS